MAKDRLLQEAYKVCACGKKLEKRTRCAMVLLSPFPSKILNFGKPRQEFKPGGDSVSYMCPECFTKLYKLYEERFCYYPEYYGIADPWRNNKNI